MDLALSNLQRLYAIKPKPNQTKPNNVKAKRVRVYSKKCKEPAFRLGSKFGISLSPTVVF